MISPQTALLPDGRRLHLQHGPIDLIVEAFGEAGEIERAYRQASARFDTVLDELVAELGALRRPLDQRARFEGETARRMARAIEPLAARFITPMAAVAGAVAETILAAMTRGRRLGRAYVNNGGDIALYLAPRSAFKVGVVASLAPPTLAGHLRVEHADAVRGVATSGWHGRSLSLGIADAVTVLAATAAGSDAAATIIANAVDLPGHPAIRRQPARALDPDSDLDQRLVTVAVGRLTAAETEAALERGLATANRLRARGLIETAALSLNACLRLAGDDEAECLAAATCPAPAPTIPEAAQHA